MSNQSAPKGQVYVCSACGKRSRDKYGMQKIDLGWDVSCMMNSILVSEESLVTVDGRVVAATAIRKES